MGKDGILDLSVRFKSSYFPFKLFSRGKYLELLLENLFFLKFLDSFFKHFLQTFNFPEKSNRNPVAFPSAYVLLSLSHCRSLLLQLLNVHSHRDMLDVI
jgi:hypothetical protein